MILMIDSSHRGVTVSKRIFDDSQNGFLTRT